MKLSFPTPFASSNQELSPKTLILGALLVVGIAGLAAALNGGSALGASDFDSLITYLKANWLQSTFVIFLCVASLLGTLWQLLHGKGLGNLSTIILLLVVGVSLQSWLLGQQGFATVDYGFVVIQHNKSRKRKSFKVRLWDGPRCEAQIRRYLALRLRVESPSKNKDGKCKTCGHRSVCSRVN